MIFYSYSTSGFGCKPKSNVRNHWDTLFTPKCVTHGSCVCYIERGCETLESNLFSFSVCVGFLVWFH